jgi:NAD(P)-dependent dehydrogenase (short-subunit alcohol dehydrogenase family)
LVDQYSSIAMALFGMHLRTILKWNRYLTQVSGENMTGRLDAVRIAITGGCGDIGRATASRLVAEGAQVYLFDVLPQEKGNVIAASIAPPSVCSYLVCDVTVQASVREALDSIGHIDVAICNAAIVKAGSVVDIKPEEWLESLAVNLTGAFYTAQAAARLMLRQEPNPFGIRGKILFTGSWVQDMPFPGIGSYIASKGGLKMLAKVMAQELALSGIRVNIVAPGLVMAGLTKQLYDSDPEYRTIAAKAVPVGEFQSVESVAASFAFLCSHDADYMTGATVLVDGGSSLVRRD